MRGVTSKSDDYKRRYSLVKLPHFAWPSALFWNLQDTVKNLRGGISEKKKNFTFHFWVNELRNKSKYCFYERQNTYKKLSGAWFALFISFWLFATGFLVLFGKFDVITTRDSNRVVTCNYRVYRHQNTRKQQWTCLSIRESIYIRVRLKSPILSIILALLLV